MLRIAGRHAQIRLIQSRKCELGGPNDSNVRRKVLLGLIGHEATFRGVVHELDFGIAIEIEPPNSPKRGSIVIIGPDRSRLNVRRNL